SGRKPQIDLPRKPSPDGFLAARQCSPRKAYITHPFDDLSGSAAPVLLSESGHGSSLLAARGGRDATVARSAMDLAGMMHELGKRDGVGSGSASRAACLRSVPWAFSSAGEGGWDPRAGLAWTR